ncbi:MAG: hypothetical protein OXQ92_04205 [Boseongicola sp.]|nr:hypothetical protein [Boseongicola sp.]
MARLAKLTIEEIRDEVLSLIAFDQPDLNIIELSDDKVEISGRLFVMPKSPENQPLGALDQFEVRIVIPIGFPAIEPLVFETGGRIERELDYHVKPNGSCCYSVWPAWLADAKDQSISEVVSGPIMDFFRWQYVRLNGIDAATAIGERQHYISGLLDAYAEVLDCSPTQKSVSSHLKVLRRKWLRSRWRCPCGSRKKIGVCCETNLRKIKGRVSPEIAEIMQEKLNSQSR